ncbi:MAG: hypothetical protein WCI88_00085 [Chloroflexota bacterium]
MRYIGVRWIAIISILVMAIFACSYAENEKEQLSTAPDANATINPTSTIQLALTPKISFDPFLNRKMIFGLTQLRLGDPQDINLSKELGVSWISSQPFVIWVDIEKVPGYYDWSKLDEEVSTIQQMNLDCVIVLIPMTLAPEEQAKIKKETGAADYRFLLFKNDSGDVQLYPHTEAENNRWKNFIRALVDRYNGDGVNDAPHLRFPVRNWQILDQFPSPWFSDVKTYLNLLRISYQGIKSIDPTARVLLAGVASENVQRLAFANGDIEDNEAGVVAGTRFGRPQVGSMKDTKIAKLNLEFILKEGKGSFDIADLHLYVPKTTFVHGEITWLRNLLLQYGYNIPVWITEAGGPYKLRAGQKSSFGDYYYGYYTDKENAEFVIKIHVLAAVDEVERFNWRLAETEGKDFYNGPYSNMGLIHPNSMKKPSYFAYKNLRNFLQDFSNVIDLSSKNVKLYEFSIGSQKKYIGWLEKETKQNTIDLSKYLPRGILKIVPVITALDSRGNALQPDNINVEIYAVPMGITPIFIEGQE